MGKTKETANLVSNGLLTPNISDIGIGIGTTNPTAALDVLGDVNITGVITATSFVGNITGGVTGDATGLSGSPSITVTDITASGNVSIAGTLTYEDVTNVDSVGLITARSGIIATGNVGIGTDSNLTANLTVGNIENTSVTNKGALAIKTLSNSDSDIGASAIYIEEPDFGYGFYHKVTSYYGATHHQIQESGSGNVLLTISDTGDIGIKTNYADTFALKILSEDENVIKIENSSNGSFGSDIRIVQDSNSPAANDKLLTLDIRGNDSGGNETTYAEIISLIEDPTNGSEDGKLTIQTRTSGTLTDRIVIDSGGVGIGTTNAVNSDFHVEGRNFSFGGPGDNFSGEGNLYIGNYNNPLLDPWASRNIRIGSQSEIQIELFTDWDGTQYSDSIIFSSPDGLGWQYNANKSGVSRSGIYPMYYSAGNAITDDYLFFQAGNKYLWFDADTGRLGVNRGTGNGWTDTLDVNGTARVTGVAKFDSNVGIGEDGPSCRLQVKDTATHTAYASQTPSIGDCTISVVNNPSSEAINNHATIQFNVTGGTYNRVCSISAIAESASNRYSSLTFCTDDAGSRTEKVRITSDGRLLVGTTTTRANFFNSTNWKTQVQIENNSDQESSLSLICSHPTSNQAGLLILGATKASSIGGNGLTGSSQGLGIITFQGNDGTNMVEAARIACVAAGSPGADNMPGELRFSVNSGSGSATERLRILSSGGITFNGDTAAANALDDYEEGTWTPVIDYSGSNPSVTYSNREGTYTKIGRMVYVFFDMNASSISSGSGFAQISGLPYTVSNNMAGYSVVQWRDSSAIAAGGSETQLKGFAQRGNTYLYIQIDNSGSSGYGYNSSRTWNSSGRTTGYAIYEA